METVRNFLNNLHFGTRFLLIFMTCFWILQATLFDRSWNGYLTIQPYSVCQKGQVWRLVTAMFGHLGLFHLFSNMVSLTFLGMTLETTLGTLCYFYHILVFGVLGNLLYCGIAYFMYLGGEPSHVYSSAMGFSGVLFTLIVIDVHLSGGSHRSVFGLFTVPSWVYPWVMLVLLSILMPNVSLLGHFAGLAVGYMYQFNLLKWLAPSTQFFSRIERNLCRCCTSRLGYIHTAGVHDAHNFMPYAVWQPRFAGEQEDEAPTTTGFRGTARTIGETPAPPVEVENKDEEFHSDDLEPMQVNSREDL